MPKMDTSTFSLALVSTEQLTMTSLAFPFDREALVALESYAKNGHDYLQFSIGKH
jgi:hypothetical protein